MLTGGLLRGECPDSTPGVNHCIPLPDGEFATVAGQHERDIPGPVALGLIQAESFQAQGQTVQGHGAGFVAPQCGGLPAHAPAFTPDVFQFPDAPGVPDETPAGQAFGVFGVRQDCAIAQGFAAYFFKDAQVKQAGEFLRGLHARGSMRGVSMSQTIQATRPQVSKHFFCRVFPFLRIPGYNVLTASAKAVPRVCNPPLGDTFDIRVCPDVILKNLS